jgi:hypothetical protein
MRHAALLIAIGLVLIIPARSQGATNTKAQEKAAKKACAAGDFRKGVEILAELYVETDDTTHIFNQGRCYEQNHQWVSAIDRFREYLRKNSNASATEKGDAQKHIADCEAYREQEEAKLAPPTVTSSSPPPVAFVPPTPSPAAPAAAPEPVAVERAEAQHENTGSGLRVTGIVLGSVGLAAAATGLLLNLKANSLGSEYNKNQDSASKSSYSSYKTGALIGYAAGGGMLVAGIVLYLVGRSAGPGEQTSQVAVLPVLAPSQFSIALRSGF